MPRSIASLSLSFGLVSIPVKLYSATESSSAIVSARTVEPEIEELSPVVVERRDMVKGVRIREREVCSIHGG